MYGAGGDRIEQLARGDSGGLDSVAKQEEEVLEGDRPVKAVRGGIRRRRQQGARRLPHAAPRILRRALRSSKQQPSASPFQFF